MLKIRRSSDQNAITMNFNGVIAKVIWVPDGLLVDAIKEIRVDRYFDPRPGQGKEKKKLDRVDAIIKYSEEKKNGNI